METKKCPYCSEEILLDAKKCKHCNEWIVKDEEVDITQKNIEKKIAKQDYKLLIILCYVAMFFALVNTGHDLGIHGLEDVNTDIGSGKSRIFKWILGVITIIPEWIAILIDTILWVILILGIRKLYQGLNKTMKIPFVSLSIFESILGFISLIASLLIENEDNEIYLAFIGFAFLVLIPYFIIMIVTGVKLRKHNDFNNFPVVGLSFILYPIFILVLSIISANYKDDFFISFISNSLMFLVSLYPLFKIRDLFIEVSSTDTVDEEKCVELIEKKIQSINNTNGSTLTIIYKGKYFLFDRKTKIFFNDIFHSEQSIKNGFEISIPITEEKNILKIEYPKTTLIHLELEKEFSYEIEIFYDEDLDKFSDKYKMIKFI